MESEDTAFDTIDPEKAESEPEKPESVPTLQLNTQNSVDKEIEAHLENINKAINEINTLSRDFMRARDEFIKAYEVAKAKLGKMYASNKKTIDRARPFYLARDAAYRAKYEHRKSTTRLKQATDDAEEAKTKAKKAEDDLLSSARAGSGGTDDPELLTNLNKANDTVIEATRTRTMADHDQTLCMSELCKADDRLALTAQQLTKHVLRASTYYDTRDKMQRQLDAQYYKLWEKSKKVQDAKQQHKDMFAQFTAISTQFAQVKCADEYQSKPPDLSQFEEIHDVDSLDSSFQDLEENHSSRMSQSFDISSVHSVGSTSDLNISVNHVTNSAKILTPDEMADLDLSDRSDISGQNEIFVDYGVSFQMDV